MSRPDRSRSKPRPLEYPLIDLRLCLWVTPCPARCRGGAWPTRTAPRSTPMRKLALAIATMLFMAGLVVAAEVTIIKYDKDKKEVTVKDGEKEKTYKITDKTKFSVTTKDGDKDLEWA